MATAPNRRPYSLHPPYLSKHRGIQIPEKPSFHLRFVSDAHKSDNDTLCPRRTKLCRARAVHNFATSFTDRVDIWFRVWRFHGSFSYFFCAAMKSEAYLPAGCGVRAAALWL